jgi:hypothetical protein
MVLSFAQPQLVRPGWTCAKKGRYVVEEGEMVLLKHRCESGREGGGGNVERRGGRHYFSHTTAPTRTLGNAHAGGRQRRVAPASSSRSSPGASSGASSGASPHTGGLAVDRPGHLASVKGSTHASGVHSVRGSQREVIQRVRKHGKGCCGHRIVSTVACVAGTATGQRAFTPGRLRSHTHVGSSGRALETGGRDCAA